MNVVDDDGMCCLKVRGLCVGSSHSKFMTRMTSGKGYDCKG